MSDAPLVVHADHQGGRTYPLYCGGGSGIGTVEVLALGG